MITVLEIIATCTVLALLLNMPYVLHARRRRKLAAAKLEVTTIINEMSDLLRQGKLEHCDMCTDRLLPAMFHLQFDSYVRVTWQWWRRPSAESKKIQEWVHEQRRSGSALGNLLGRFMKARFQCFRTQQFFSFWALVFWVLFCAGGLAVIVIGLIGVFTAKMAWQNFCEAFSPKKFEKLISEWLFVLGVRRLTSGGG